jgi:hypothetical protein
LQQQLEHWRQLPIGSATTLTPSLLLDPCLLQCLGDVVECTADPWLLECFWQGLDTLSGSLLLPAKLQVVPLLGVPIVNRMDLLERLLTSLDVPVQTLAIVDNSGNGEASLGKALQLLAETPHPWIERIHVARSFGNLGVAASWNQILRAFPASPLALLANNDVAFAPGVLRRLLDLADPSDPQLIPLLPGPAAFSAFAITPAAWDRIGLFSEDFYPAYFEDLDYRDRLREDPAVTWIDDPEIQAAMQVQAANQVSSATIASDPILAEANARSFQLNRLWYLSRRRLRGNPRGQWLRRWLCSWPDPSVS